MDNLIGNLVEIIQREETLLKDFLEYLGIEPGRVQFSWVSASEGSRFAELAKKVIKDVKELGPANKLLKETE